MAFLYEDRYFFKIVLAIIFSLFVAVLSYVGGYELIVVPAEQVGDFHVNVLTVNSIISGFSLTNLGILLSISDDQLIRKLEGTDILQKRNVVIAHSIIFGAISIFIATLFMFHINIDFQTNNIIQRGLLFIKTALFYLEILGLIISIAYFLLSIKKMIDLLSLIHVPRKRYSDEQIQDMKKKLETD